MQVPISILDSYIVIGKIKQDWLIVWLKARQTLNEGNRCSLNSGEEEYEGFSPN